MKHTPLFDGQVFARFLGILDHAVVAAQHAQHVLHRRAQADQHLRNIKLVAERQLRLVKISMMSESFMGTSQCMIVRRPEAGRGVLRYRLPGMTSFRFVAGGGGNIVLISMVAASTTPLAMRKTSGQPSVHEEIRPPFWRPQR